MPSGEAPHVDLRVTYFTPYSYLFPTHSRPPFSFLGSPLPFFPWLVIEATLYSISMHAYDGPLFDGAFCTFGGYPRYETIE